MRPQPTPVPSRPPTSHLHGDERLRARQERPAREAGGLAAPMDAMGAWRAAPGTWLQHGQRPPHLSELVLLLLLPFPMSQLTF